MELTLNRPIQLPLENVKISRDSLFPSRQAQVQELWTVAWLLKVLFDSQMKVKYFNLINLLLRSKGSDFGENGEGTMDENMEEGAIVSPQQVEHSMSVDSSHSPMDPSS